jgi:hypothetical protein
MAFAFVVALSLPTATSRSAPQTAWVIYANELGWLRVGTQAEFDKPWKKGQEIWGGKSEEPLKKETLQGGFASRDEALQALCQELARVRLKSQGMATPRWTTNALYRGKEYNLHLDRGGPIVDDLLPGGMDYNLDTEISILAQHKVTPRMVFGLQYLCHVYKHDTMQGPENLNVWMCEPNRPEGGGFWIPDDYGMQMNHYWCDKFEGPFMDSFSMAEAMKRHKADRVKLWPSSLKGEVNAALVPDDPKDYGSRATPVQPWITPPEMLDWVIYATEANWLRVGTRTEFKTPRKRNQEIWAGTSEQPIPKTLVAEGFKSCEQAQRALCAGLTKVRWQFAARNEPRFIVLGLFKGKEYRLQLVRAPYQLVAGGLGYDYDAERLLLARHGVTPRLVFGNQWLVHSLQVSTISGPQKTDRWMMVTEQPKGQGVAVPDGGGGWFIHGIDPGGTAGPFTDSFALAAALKARKTKGVYLAGGGQCMVNPDWVPDNPSDNGRPPRKTQPKISGVEPAKAKQGAELYVTIFGEDIEPGADVSLGEGIAVTNLSYFGHDPDQGSQDSQWLATLAIVDDAPVGLRDVTVRNMDGGQGVGSKLFEVLPEAADECPFVKLVAPKSAEFSSEAAGCARYKSEQEQHISLIRQLKKERTGEAQGQKRDAKLRELWTRLQDARKEMESAERLYWEPLAYVVGDLTEAEIRTLQSSIQARCECLFDSSQKRLDEWRKTWFSPLNDSEYADRERQYKDTFEALNHTLNLGRTLASWLQSRREFELQMARRGKAVGEDVDLAPFQRRLFEVHIAQGWLSLLKEQAMVEMSLQMQDSCGAAIRATRQKAGDITTSGSTKTGKKAAEGSTQTLLSQYATAAAEYGMIGARYMVGVLGALFSRSVDLVKQGWNMTLGWFLPELDTLSADIQKRINESRKEFRDKCEAMRNLAATPDKERIMLAKIVRADGLAAVPNLAVLDNDRIGFEETDGGVYRFASCFDESYTLLMESEYNIMLRRADLALRDMRRTLSMQIGADPKTGQTSFWKRLINPMATVRIACAEWTQGEFSTREKFLAERAAELKMMREMLPQFRKLKFNLSLLTYEHELRAKHYALKIKNPAYLQWCIKMRALQASYVADQIEVELLDAWESQDIHELKRMRGMCALVQVHPTKRDWARYWQLDGADRLMVWDWQGAIVAFDQAAKTDPKVQSPEGVDRLREALGWKQATEIGVETFEYVGNQGIMSALSGMLGRWGGQLIAKYKGVDLKLAADAVKKLEAGSAAPGILGRFATAKYWGGFGHYVWSRVNPFNELVSFRSDWDKCVKGILSTGREVLEEVVQGAGTQALVYFGADKDWADFIAQTLVESASTAHEESQDLATFEALGLVQHVSKWKRLWVDIGLLKERSAGRADLEQAVKILEYLARADRAREKLEAEAVRKNVAELNTAQVRDLSQQVHAAEQQVRNQVEPLTVERVQQTSDLVLEKLKAAKTQAERMELLVNSLRDLPFDVLRGTFKDNAKHPLSVRVDGFRREILSAIQVKFMGAFPQYAQWFVGFTTYGSAAHPEWAGYKCIWSDLDFTMLLKRDTPGEVREAMKRDFDTFFTNETGMTPGSLDIHSFADTLPVFRAKVAASVLGEATGLARALAENPNLAEDLAREADENLQLLWRNMVDPERNLLPGNLVLFNYLVKMVGKMQAAELIQVDDHYELKTDPSGFDQIYGNLRFEGRHGFDILLDHLGQIGRVRERHAKDMFAYSKDLAKYSIRVLLARIIQLPEGLDRMNSATSDEVARAGGLEAFIVRVAREIGPQKLGFKLNQQWLLGEWISRKEARPFSEIFETRAGARLAESDPKMNNMIADHINDTERFLLETVKFTIEGQGRYLQQLMQEAERAENPAVRLALETRVREVICSQAALWYRLRPNERHQIQLMAPRGAPFWRLLHVYGELKQLADDQRGVVDYSVIRNWWSRDLLEGQELKVAEYADVPETFRDRVAPWGPAASSGPPVEPKRTPGPTPPQLPAKNKGGGQTGPPKLPQPAPPTQKPGAKNQLQDILLDLLDDILKKK